MGKKYCDCHMKQFEEIEAQLKLKKVQWDRKNKCLKCGNRVHHQVRKVGGKVSLWAYLLRKVRKR